MTSEMKGTIMGCLTRLWLQCTQPDLAEQLRYAQRILNRFDTNPTPREHLMLRHMAANAHTTISMLLADLAADWQSAGPIQRRLLAATDRYATPLMRRLQTVATADSKETSE